MIRIKAKCSVCNLERFIKEDSYLHNIQKNDRYICLSCGKKGSRKFISKKRIKKIKTKHIGVFRGNFDPPHFGHLSIILSSISLFSFKEIYWIPKKEAIELFFNRKKMVNYLIEPYSNFRCIALEETIEKSSLSEAMKIIKNKNNKYCIILGSDEAEKINEFEDKDWLIENFSFIVFYRKGFPFTKSKEFGKSLKMYVRDNYLVSNISSNDLRKGNFENNQMRLTSKKVQEVIEKGNLYGQERRRTSIL